MKGSRPSSRSAQATFAFAPAVLAGALFVVVVAWMTLRTEAVDTDATLFGAVPALVFVCVALGCLFPERGWRHGLVAAAAAGLLGASVLVAGGTSAAVLVRGIPFVVALAAATTFASAVGSRVRRTLGAHVSSR